MGQAALWRRDASGRGGGRRGDTVLGEVPIERKQRVAELIGENGVQ